MSLLTWCKLTAVRGLQKFLSPLAIQSRSASNLDNQPTCPQATFKEDDKPLFRYGYYDRYRRKGLLVHKDTLPRVSVLKKYRPPEPWIPKNALFGQNDYIDILGNGEIHPVNVLYTTPHWLRGFKGHEIAVLIRRRKIFSKSNYPDSNPKKWHMLNKRIHYLYKFLNKKTRTPGVYRKT